MVFEERIPVTVLPAGDGQIDINLGKDLNNEFFAGSITDVARLAADPQRTGDRR